MKWGTTPEANADLIAARHWIEGDNPEAAQRMLATARECFELIGQYPEAGPLARLNEPEFEGMRFLFCPLRSTNG